MIVALVVFGLAFVVFVYFAIACEVAYSSACRERTNRDTWVATSPTGQATPNHVCKNCGKERRSWDSPCTCPSEVLP